jgi:thiol-disulfide isomerase/thioredoxin
LALPTISLGAVRRALEVCANSALIVLCVVAVGRSLKPDGTIGAEEGQLSLDRVSVPGATTRAAAILAYKLGCEPCQRTTPQYKLLADEARRLGVTFVVVTPDTPSAVQEVFGSRIEVQQRDLRPLGFKATPTLVIRDDSGAVARVWRGALDDERGEEVRRYLSEFAAAR